MKLEGTWRILNIAYCDCIEKRLLIFVIKFLIIKNSEDAFVVTVRPVSKNNESNRSIPRPVFKLLLIILYLQLFHFIIFEKSVRIVFFLCTKIDSTGPNQKGKIRQ